MLPLSVLSGSDGLLFWSYEFAENSWNDSILYPTLMESRKYLPAIIQGKNLSNTVKASNIDVEVKLFSIPNTKKYLAIAINHERLETNLTLNFNRTFAGKIVTANRRQIARLSANASFNSILKPYEVLVWTIG